VSYIKHIQSLLNPSFDAIRSIAMKEIAHLPKAEKDKLWKELDRGTALLNTHFHMCQYLHSFGKMHQAKLLDVFKRIPKLAYQNDIEIVDWGCGQAMGTLNLFDYLNGLGLAKNIKKVTLIEPSEVALERGKLHVSVLGDSVEVVAIADYFENVNPKAIATYSNRVVLHIFSNILDVAQIDLKHLANLIDGAISSNSYLICVGPLNPTNQRIDAFFRYFDKDLIENIYQYEDSNFLNNGWTYKGKVYKLEKNKTGHLIPIEYFPTVQFHAAYELDAMRTYRNQKQIKFNKSLASFEVAAPYDLGASVYDDVHPILAVLNNIICRGLPTRTSVFIEESFSKAFNLTQRDIQYGEINYNISKEINLDDCVNLFELFLDKELKFDSEKLIKSQLSLTPIAIARFQKVLLEAIITGQLPIQSSKWRILVEEKDVPFSNIAVEDFKNTFNHLISLSEDFTDFKLPEIELFVISNQRYCKSKLHGSNLIEKVTTELKAIEFDMVVTHEILKSVNESTESFSEFKAKNKCYFNIRSIAKHRTERSIYTSTLIKYKNLVEKTQQGQFIEIESPKTILTYFVQLLFRKEAFRPGQLPILDRALQNLPVIGLLPTGGGKSLTYQLAALLQPGVTMIIDPLKSLMKDQHDGLINNGIDCAAFINSTLSSEEKKERERQLESSQLLFVFLSPERLSIASFRERLKNMHNYNVYFSYGVIDEVHCVSEWGHDFRFSYLHLGRNLYNYVKAKEKEISLFGLTATASFDVLADVERELSGNGAFALDADVIVRYENTNRLELQYKIERVEAEFEVDIFYDKNKVIEQNLPKAVNITNHWPLFDSKSKFLKEYVKIIPKYLKELQLDSNIKYIKEKFIHRQDDNIGTETDLKVEITDNYYKGKEEYKEAGIVFCPHAGNKTNENEKSSSLSVVVNSKNLIDIGVLHTASFTGKDDSDTSIQNLELFKNNKSPLMVATKAFGMGIDKPNVRFTINMNYSSSLESFVQEAGRAGRDRKMALATILLSDYKLVQISRRYQSNDFPLALIKSKWFKEEDLKQILDHYKISVPVEYLLYATPGNDIAKLHCSKDNKMFGFNQCSDECSEYKKCSLRKVTPETKGWKTEIELIQEIKAQNLNITRKSFQYLNADYQTVMYFFNESFKGDIIEKQYMNMLLNRAEVHIENGLKIEESITTKGFLSTLLKSEINTEIVVFIPYIQNDYADLSKAIYRMTCIELIEDFTQDYSNQLFRIVTKRKETGEYYNGLKRFLLRYFTNERAGVELEKVKKITINIQNVDDLSEEIYKCLSYLTEFVYDKISEKRKRAIDDMRNFCMEGLETNSSWIVRNENLKDFIYYYFNSKYAKTDYIADNGEPFSLVEDTEGGKKSSIEILFKYLRVIDDDITGVGVPLDNVKHLYGAVRLISRSLTDSNPALYLLEVFCLAYMGTRKNQNLIDQLVLRYSEGMIEFSNRIDQKTEFWELFKKFNKVIENFVEPNELKTLAEETSFLILASTFKTLTKKYIENYE
jgi:superfamily II DNA helicase RecQ